MKFKWFLTGWLGHALANAAMAAYISNQEWRAYQREIQKAGKRLADEIRAHKDLRDA
jgi:glycine/serine hydroxymethyltransferase